MDWYPGIVVLIVYSVISAFLLVRTLLCLRARTASFAGYLRLLSILPAAIYGGVAVSALSSRVRNWGYGAGDPVLVSEALHTVTGFSLCVWNVIACYAISRISKWKFALTWSNKRRCPGYFVVFTIDIMFLAPMIAGCAVATTYLPSQWLFSSCDSDHCRSEMMVQVMAIIHMFQVLGSAILIAPLIMVPRRIAAPVFAFAEHVQRPFRSRDKFNGEHDLEKAILVSEDERSQALGTLFRHDAIAATIARHLHVDDVSNVSMTSKHLRRSILCPSPADRSQRKELLCENACINGTKDECWACTKVICEACSTLKTNALVPRTGAHIFGCYAVCSRCYISHAQLQPAPLAARWKQHDLSVQHSTDCYKRAPSTLRDPVRLCASCASLEPGPLQEARELRERVSLKKTLVGRIRCHECEIVLSQKARRWWFCDAGHECSWSGHKL